ncbi:MAG: heme exporter protein CcmB [Thermoplasmata archaeon]|nr:MAG: heme exporter protein CcmB [Thermoplasmata archaeon]
MMSQAITIARKDIKTEFRTREMIFSMVVFSLLIIMAFRFAFEFYLEDSTVTSGPEEILPLVSPILWVTFCFAGMLGLLTSFAKEKDRGSLDGLMLCPMDRSAIYFGKVLSNFFLILIVDITSVIFFWGFFSFDFQGNIASVMIVILLGTFCYVVIGTLISSISVNARGKEVLFAILLIPLILFTVLLPSITATSMALEGRIMDAMPELRLLGAFALIYVAMGYVLFNFVLEE